jgi:aspartyl protease family protein
MVRLASLLVVGCLISIIAVSADCANAVGDDAIKTNGLTLSGAAYVLNDESDILKQLPALRTTKKQVDEDARIRKALQAKINSSATFSAQSAKEHDQLNDKLSVINDRVAHNRIVLRMNQLVIKMKESAASRKESEEKLAKLDQTLTTKYVDDVLALDTKAQSALKTYTTLSLDPAVKAALEKANRSASARANLGPTTAFVAAAGELTKYRTDIDSEAISLTEEGGVHGLSVLVNGAPVNMIIDSGASMVTLPGEIAENLNLVPGTKDPTVEMKLADGHVIQVRKMTLKTVRVGRFTVENVTCAVMAKGLNNAPAVLGNSFLSHFVVKLDQKAGQLHLIEVETGEKKPGSTGAVPVVGDKLPAK